MENGKVVEMGSPESLTADNKSAFSKFVEATC